MIETVDVDPEPAREDVLHDRREHDHDHGLGADEIPLVREPPQQ